MPSPDLARLSSFGEGGAAWAKVSSLGLVVAAITVLYWVGLIIYRLWFHPLSRFPGPALMTVSDLPYLVQNNLLGTFANRVEKLHRRYGNIVRIGPNDLAIDGSVGWADVCNYRPGQGQGAEFTKPRGYFWPGDDITLINAPNREAHRRYRRAMAAGFKEGAMYEQEPIIMYYVDLLCQRLSELSKDGSPVNILRWFNMMTFDLIGDLSFGESFHSLEMSDEHFWIKNLGDGIKGMHMVTFFHKIGPMLLPLASLIPSAARALKTNQENWAYSNEKTQARLRSGPDRPTSSASDQVGVDGNPKQTVRRDFMSYMMSSGDGCNKEQPLSERELRENAHSLTIAGSETAATNMATLFFLLSLPRNRASKDIAVAEVRNRFSRESDVTLRSVQAGSLPFLTACIDEAMRIHPPAAIMAPRVSPGGLVNGEYIPKGTVIFINHGATFHNPNNFAEPDSFLPQRFLPPDHPLYERRFDADNKACFKPFSTGPRDCIGKSLAYAEMRLVAARILLRFDVEFVGPEDWIEANRSFTVWVKPPLMLKLTERENLELKGR
ncbi:hypothetical protein RB600_008943 [Gaeumannomyces tritici]